VTKVAPFHSNRPGETRHHDNDKCTEGNNIEQRYLTAGTGGRPLCSHCDKLDREGK
jgi:hypothetical protein